MTDAALPRRPLRDDTPNDRNDDNDDNDTPGPARRPLGDGGGPLPSPWLMPRHLARASAPTSPRPSPSPPPYAYGRGHHRGAKKFNDVSPDEPMMFASASAAAGPGIDHPLAGGAAPNVKLEPTFAPFLSGRASGPSTSARHHLRAFASVASVPSVTSWGIAQPPLSPVKKQRTRGEGGGCPPCPPWAVPDVPAVPDGESDEENSPLSSPQVLLAVPAAGSPLRSRASTSASTGSSPGQCTPSKRSRDGEDDGGIVDSPFTPSGQLPMQDLRINGTAAFPSLSSASPAPSSRASASSSSLAALPLPKDCIAGGRPAGVGTPDRTASAACSGTPRSGGTAAGSPFQVRRTPIGQRRGSVFQTLPPRSGGAGQSPYARGGDRTRDDDDSISAASGGAWYAPRAPQQPVHHHLLNGPAPPPLVASVGSFGSSTAATSASPKVVPLTVLDPSEGSPYAPRRALHGVEGTSPYAPRRALMGPPPLAGDSPASLSSRVVVGRHVRSGSGFSAGSRSLDLTVVSALSGVTAAHASPLMKSLDGVLGDGPDSSDDDGSDDDGEGSGLGPWTCPRLNCPSLQASPMSNSSVHHLPKIKLTPRGKNPLLPSPGGSATLAIPALTPNSRRGRPSPGGHGGEVGGPPSLAAMPPLSLSGSPRRHGGDSGGPASLAAMPPLSLSGSPRRGGDAARRPSSPPGGSSPAGAGSGMPPLSLPGPSLLGASRALGNAHRGPTPDDMSSLLSGFDMHHSRSESARGGGGDDYADIDPVESDETEIVAAMSTNRHHSSQSLFWTTSTSHDDVSRLGTVAPAVAASLHVPVPSITLGAYGSAPRDGAARSSPHFLPRPLPPIAQTKSRSLFGGAKSDDPIERLISADAIAEAERAHEPLTDDEDSTDGGFLLCLPDEQQDKVHAGVGIAEHKPASPRRVIGRIRSPRLSSRNRAPSPAFGKSRSSARRRSDLSLSSLAEDETLREDGQGLVVDRFHPSSQLSSSLVGHRLKSPTGTLKGTGSDATFFSGSSSDDASDSILNLSLYNQLRAFESQQSMKSMTSLCGLDIVHESAQKQADSRARREDSCHSLLLAMKSSSSGSSEFGPSPSFSSPPSGCAAAARMPRSELSLNSLGLSVDSLETGAAELAQRDLFTPPIVRGGRANPSLSPPPLPPRRGDAHI